MTFLTFPSKLTLQQACQLGVSVRNKSIFLAFIPKGTDHITQRQKAAIDADACGGNQMARIKLVVVQNEHRFKDDIFISLGIIKSKGWQQWIQGAQNTRTSGEVYWHYLPSDDLPLLWFSSASLNPPDPQDEI